MVLVAAGQLCSTRNIRRNLEICSNIIMRASKAGAKAVFLPEASDFIASNASESIALTNTPECTDFVAAMQDAARTNGVEVNVGVHQPAGERVSNASLWINADGKITHIYKKLHLFDVSIKDGPTIKESNSTEPGTEIVKPFESICGRIGMAICFDLRFPELSTCLTQLGAQVLLYPSAFAVRTGQAHWEPLLRARAIENGCYVIASAQAGMHNDKRTSYGNSMIVDPWGKVIAQAGDDVAEDGEFILADIDHELTESVREQIPLHRRYDVYNKNIE